MHRTLILSAALAALAASLASPAVAARVSPHFWATVNICDTARHPDQMGVRGSMPGNGTSQRMYMRFRAQFYDRGRRAWRPVAGRFGSTSWRYAGSARFRSRQHGHTFEFSLEPGETFTLRGVVDFEWRARRRRGGRVRTVVVKRGTRITQSGIRGVDFADPPRYSRARCQIR